MFILQSINYPKRVSCK